MMTWTCDKEKKLRTLWEHSTLSATQIGECLGGISRCAVLGKVHRLGLSARAEPLAPPPYAPAKPGRGRPGWAKYPWNSLEVGQSFFTPAKTTGMYPVARSFGIKISVHREFRDGVRGIAVRRVA